MKSVTTRSPSKKYDRNVKKMNEKILSVIGVSKSYKNKKVSDDISSCVNQRAIIARYPSSNAVFIIDQ